MVSGYSSRKPGVRRGQVRDRDETLHRIIVVGGGAAGLELATRLGDALGKRKQARVTLIERSRTHLWKPLLHQAAAGSLDVGEHELDYLAQAHWHHFIYRFGEMTGLDRTAKEVQIAATFDEEGRQITPPRSFRYDTLVIAVGSVVNDFNTPGAKAYAVPLETADEAVRFNRRLVNACIRAHAQEGPVRSGQLHVAIIGAGATGTELAAELHRTARAVVAFGLDRIDAEKDIRITLIEAAPRILPALPDRISHSTSQLLKNVGVQIRTSARVTEVRSDGVMLADREFIPAELVVWAAGVRGPDVLYKLDGLEVNSANQLMVTELLQTTRDPNIFAIGDCAACPWPGHSTPVPPRAQAAHQQAAHLFRQILRRLAGQPLEPYRYRDFGSLVSLGRHSTVGNLMGFLIGKDFMVEGYFARLTYRSLYVLHEMALHGILKTVLNVMARMLGERAGPMVKLH